MQSNKKNWFLSVVLVAAFVMPAPVRAEEEIIEDVEIAEYEEVEDTSADAVENYDVSGSLFQQITDLEQEKVLMQLEKERAQLDLELDRLAAEKIKLHMEIDTLSGRAEQQQQEFEMERAKLENEAARLELERERMLNAEVEEEPVTRVARSSSSGEVAPEEDVINVADNYRLVNVFGAGAQLQATVQDLATGQNKRLSVGKKLDGLTVKSISLDEGIVFVSDGGATQNLNVSGGK